MSKMSLEVDMSIMDRISVLQILPEKGDILTARLVSKLREVVGFDEEEQIRLGIQNKNGGIVWNPENDIKKKFSFGERTVKLLREAVLKMNADGDISQQFISLYEIFVGEVDNDVDDCDVVVVE